MIIYKYSDCGYFRRIFGKKEVIYIMMIKGLQKLTLLDFPGKIACTVFTGGCNLRCPFCHNALLVTEQDETFIPTEEFFAFLSERADRLEGVAITGGEPLMQKDIESFIKRIKDMGYAVKLDTNGTYPDKLKKILDEKLVDYVAIDIKNSPEKYAVTAGVSNLDVEKIKKSVKILMESGVDYEFRTTVPKELFTEEDFEKIAQWIAGAKRYFLQEFKDSGNLIEEDLFTPESKEVMEKYASIVRKTVKQVEVRGI